MEVKKYGNESLISLCAWKVADDCPDKFITNEDAIKVAAELKVKAISHSICEKCAKIINQQIDGK